jgi:hypothetical protein
MAQKLDFEKLGSFYLGKRYDADADRLTDEPVLYEARDLATHGATCCSPFQGSRAKTSCHG